MASVLTTHQKCFSITLNIFLGLGGCFFCAPVPVCHAKWVINNDGLAPWIGCFLAITSSTTHPDTSMQYKYQQLLQLPAAPPNVKCCRYMCIFNTHDDDFLHVHMCQRQSLRQYFLCCCSKTNDRMCWHTTQHIRKHVFSKNCQQVRSWSAVRTLSKCCRHMCIF